MAKFRKGGGVIHTPLFPNLQVSEVESNNNKGTSKFHKTDEKITHFAVHIPPSIFVIFKTNWITTSSTHSKMQWAIFF